MALGWAVCYASETRYVDPTEAQAVLALLLVLDGPLRRGAVSERLLELAESQRHEQRG